MTAFKRTCRECGKDISHMREGAAFCGTAHRKAWHNRRMVRGAELYDLVMALRYERDRAKQLGVMTVWANLARAYRDADVALRDGRKSWDIAEALERIPLGFGQTGDKR